MASVTVPNDATRLEEGQVLLRVSALAAGDFRLQHVSQSNEPSYIETCLETGCAGTVLSTGTNVEFQPSDAIMTCLPETIDHYRDGQEVVVRCELCCKKPDTTSMEEAARIPMSFTSAVFALKASKAISLPFLSYNEPDVPTPRNVLVLINDAPTSLLVLRLIRNTCPQAGILALCFPEIRPWTTDYILGASAHGGHWIAQPDESETKDDLIESIQDAAEEYSASKSREIDMLLDFTEKEDGRLFGDWRDVLGESGVFWGARDVLKGDFGEIFGKQGIMRELERMVESEEVKPEFMNHRMEHIA